MPPAGGAKGGFVHSAEMQYSPKGGKTFNLTLGKKGQSHDDDEEYFGGDFDSARSPPVRRTMPQGSGSKKAHPRPSVPSSHAGNIPDSPDFSPGGGRRDDDEEAKEQARLVASMLGEELSAGDIAARYDMSDSSEEEEEEVQQQQQQEQEKGAKGRADGRGGAEFDWGDQLGPMVGKLQEENLAIRAELDVKKQQVKKLGIMMNALEPVPGLDAEKLLAILDDKGDPLHRDIKDVKIIELSKKLRNSTFELQKEKAASKKASEVIMKLDQELSKKQSELDQLATPAARAAVLKSIVHGPDAVARDARDEQSRDPGVQARRLAAQLEETRHKLELLKDKNRALEQRLVQEVGAASIEGDTPADKVGAVLDEGWKGRAQQIVMLKAKIKRMEANAKTGGMMNAGGDGVQGGGVTAQQRVAANNLRKDVDFKAQQELNEMDRQRQRGIEELSKAHEAMKEDFQRVEQKYQSAKTRVGCLENDNAKMRDGMKVFIGKAEGDDKLIDMLKGEVQDLKKQLRVAGERETKIKREGASVKGEGSEMELLRAQVQQLMNQNSHQERIINQLRAEQHKARNPSTVPREVGEAERASRK